MNFKTNSKVIALWVIVGLFMVGLFNFYQGNFTKERHFIPLSDFIQQVKSDVVKEVVIKEQDISGTDKSGKSFVTYAPRNYDIISLLLDHDVKFTPLPQEVPGFSFFAFLPVLLSMVLFGGIWFFFFRKVQNANGRAMSFGRSRAKLSDPEKNKITFSDVAGIDEARSDLEEIVEFLKDSSRFLKIGARIPRGVLLVGPPGTGKTLLAKAIAGEAKVPFFSISGSDFVEMFVGVGASRVRDLFVQAKQQAPCIIFIDEIDAVGRHRGSGWGSDEREQTLNQLLVEMDGFEGNEDVIIVAATNRADVLDPALLRPGRFDRQISVGLPDLRSRVSILEVHLKKIRVASDVSAAAIAKGTPGFSGADLANLVNEAALYAVKNHRKSASFSDFESCRDKIIMGPERRSLLMTEEERRMTAYHEAGHAVVAYYCPCSDPIHKVTIIPRGDSLGMVVRLPEGDRVSLSRERLLEDIAVAMAGNLSEEKFFGPEKVSAGAASDFFFATRVARNMVTQWGMSKSVGPISYRENMQKFSDNVLDLSEEILTNIDQEVKRILNECQDRARSILNEHADDVELVAKTLLEMETLTGEEVDQLLKKGKLVSSEKPVKKPRAAKAPKVSLEVPTVEKPQVD